MIAQPETITALASAVIQILAAFSRPESTATLALLALVLTLVVQAKK